jgi:hypothetical protein
MSQITPTRGGGTVAKLFNKLPTPGKTGIILGILDALIFLGFWVFGGITRAVIVAFILVACEAGILVLLRLRNHRRNPKTVDSELVSQKEHFDPTIEDTTPEPTPLPELPPPTLKRQLGLFGGVAVLLLIVLLTWTTADNWIVPSVVTFFAIILGTGWLQCLFKRRKEIEWPLPVGTKVLFPVSPAEQWKVNQRIVITKDPINLLPRRPILVTRIDCRPRHLDHFGAGRAVLLPGVHRGPAECHRAGTGRVCLRRGVLLPLGLPLQLRDPRPRGAEDLPMRGSGRRSRTTRGAPGSARTW